MKIIIIRHAEPDYEKNTLTAHGFTEAEALSEAYKDFQFDEAYTSPLNRAKYTAEIFLKNHPDKKLVQKDWLVEMDTPIHVPYVDHSVLPWDFLPQHFVNEKPFFQGDKYFSSKWLQSGAIQKRYDEAAQGLDEILASNGYVRDGKLYKATHSNTKTILIFCHLGTMAVLMSHLLHVPYIFFAQHFECQTTGVTTLVTEERQQGIAQFRCLRFSDISHLTAKGIEPSFWGRFCEIFDSDDRH